MEKKHYQLKHPVRFVTATSLFDGHDVSINIMRRLLVEFGAEVIHLGHNRSVTEIVSAAIEEDAQGIAVSSYQGGHTLFFPYILEVLAQRGASHIKVFGGGGGVIVPREIRELQAAGVTRIYSPEDGRLMGLDGIVSDMLERADGATGSASTDQCLARLPTRDAGAVARLITEVELLDEGARKELLRSRLQELIGSRRAPVVGVTGTGGAGKSSLVDELVLRLLERCPRRTVAVISVDPSRKKTGGALLGDRIRMNSITSPRVYTRSLATRGAKSELSLATRDAILVCRAAGFDLVFVETSGIGQGDTEITEVSDLSIYVMTSEFGAAMQLEKIDMLDFADMIAINKFERKGAEDALADVRKQYRRIRKVAHDVANEDLPVVGTIASRFNDIGVNALYGLLIQKVRERSGLDLDPAAGYTRDWIQRREFTIIPRDRERYLAQIAHAVRSYRQRVNQQVEVATRIGQLEGAIAALQESGQGSSSLPLESLKESFGRKLLPECGRLLDGWDRLVASYSGDQLGFDVRGREVKRDLVHRTLSGTRVPRVAVPPCRDPGERLRYLMLENVPGSFPYTAGVFPLKRQDEDPKRQFAGEGGPERTNRRFHYLSRGERAKRLSVAFDSPTLYGEDPAPRPDIFGKVGESGVSICTLDDMQKLFAGFDLVDPYTSVSMTINGPAPIILAMFFNAAIEQQLARFRKETGREPTDDEAGTIKLDTLNTVRGTVQADILKEDQGQNTCIFSVHFALKMMGDMQEYFIEKGVRNYYSVSISGYHIAEAGANPISQLAFTLANGFSYVEYYRSRGMPVDSFAPNLSFFFSNGLDAEYAVIGRVARRIWAVALKELYGADERSQKLKYHIQTSGRSLHAQEMNFNDIRTTLQALMAYLDNCNSLHTNSYDEAVTTPTEESVRRAMAIQVIIARELGLAKSENASQGSYILELLTDLVEEAVLAEFERLSDRGWVLGAMETGYQRGKIQSESMTYEMQKHTGELPIVGVNTYVNPSADPHDFVPADKELARATTEEKQAQYDNLLAFQARNAASAPAAMARLKRVVLDGGNVFEELLETVRHCSLGQITNALYEVGGRYRRGM
ncbi:MAG: cobalamin B12-binding domain-containing protein [Candidatus Riflebacteria bacterium]|nr:cobalamin B12-binding domain-containing protein [Candidatus Riflebacteria bacterium]